MSKEAIEKIKDAENEARELVQRAIEERDRLIKAARAEAMEEKKAFLAKLKRERNERILRCELKGQKADQEIESEISYLAEDARKKYEALLDMAVRAAMEVLLGR